VASKIRPRGREKVRSALVASSVELFAERAPHQVTIRDIAEHANVNQALVHEYFGSKEELIKATVRHLAGVRSELLQCASDAAEAMPLMFKFQRQYPAFARLIASWLLDGRDIAELDLELDSIDRLTDQQYGPGATTRVDVRVLGAAMGTLILGSTVFRGYLDARGLAGMSDEQIGAELALLTASLHSWNRSAD
jgi:AcrR family transcriptional regulator